MQKLSENPPFTWNELYMAYITFWLFGFIVGLLLGHFG